jgi:hypothetical protein
MNAMPIQPPSAEQIIEIARSYGMHLTAADVQSFAGLLASIAPSYDRLDAMVEPKPPVK